MDFNRRILPFYMTYPGSCGVRQEDTVLRDLEYLQQMYPAEVKKYQRRIAEILDKMDYEGSLIYDEYPDKCSIRHLAGTIVQVLRREEDAEETAWPEKWQWVEDMVQVLLCGEIYKRRQGGPRALFKF